MKIPYSTLLSGFLAVFLGSFVTTYSAKANDLSGDSLILANTDVMFEACMQRCNQNTELGMLTRKGCVKGCDEMRRTFTLRKKKFKKNEDCVAAADSIELSRDLLIEKYQEWCLDTYTHIHYRKGCKDAVTTFYNAATKNNMCSKVGRSPLQDYAYTPKVTPLAPPQQTYSASPTYQSSGASYNLPQPSPSAVHNNPALAKAVTTPVFDTPKRQTPEAEARTLRKPQPSTSKKAVTSAKAPAVKKVESTPKVKSTPAKKTPTPQAKAPVKPAVTNATSPAVLEKDTPYTPPPPEAQSPLPAPHPEPNAPQPALTQQPPLSAPPQPAVQQTPTAQHPPVNLPVQSQPPAPMPPAQEPTQPAPTKATPAPSEAALPAINLPIATPPPTLPPQSPASQDTVSVPAAPIAPSTPSVPAAVPNAMPSPQVSSPAPLPPSSVGSTSPPLVPAPSNVPLSQQPPLMLQQSSPHVAPPVAIDTPALNTPEASKTAVNPPPSTESQESPYPIPANLPTEGTPPANTPNALQPSFSDLLTPVKPEPAKNNNP